jgi:hypothetical protein
MIMLIYLFSLWCTAAIAPSPNCQSPLAQRVMQAAVARWPGWVVVTPAALRAEDRQLFQKRWGGDVCPGVAVGHFVSESSEAVAVLLERRRGDLREEMVVVGLPERGSMRWHIASPADRSDVASVLRTVPPREYRSSVSAVFARSRRDAIMYEQIEAGTTLLIHNGGRFTKIVQTF